MSLWDGNLRNSRWDIVIDSILLFLIAFAHGLQGSRFLKLDSTYGVSPYSLVFNALFSNIQLAHTMLLTAGAWPTERSPVLELIERGELRGVRALGAVLGIAQVALQWLCSMCLTLVLPIHLFAFAMVHAAFILLPAMFIAPPKPSRPETGRGILIDLPDIINTWISLLFLVEQFYSQFLEFRRMSGSPGSLSLLSLGIRGWVSTAVAARWFQRFGPPTWGSQRAPLTRWYQWGWLPINYTIDGIGCAVLVALYVRAGQVGGTLNPAGESTPLP